VLNASFEPLCAVSTTRAVVLVLAEKAELLHPGEGVFRSERLSMAEPSVVRLMHYVKVPYVTRVALNRRAVFARDGQRCQYCGSSAESIDHVQPRSRGGDHIWENVVAACRPCNARKGDRTIAEAGMNLRRMPLAPRSRAWLLAAGGTVRPEWHPYLGDDVDAMTA
jgi:5-methylcytosine-specific restriction endonuclease McrA